MKTILYQPIFINPQAYFVFPQLYHIENSSTSLLMLFVKENSDRCHYYNGKWNKKDLANC